MVKLVVMALSVGVCEGIVRLDWYLLCKCISSTYSCVWWSPLSSGLFPLTLTWVSLSGALLHFVCTLVYFRLDNNSAWLTLLCRLVSFCVDWLTRLEVSWTATGLRPLHTRIIIIIPRCYSFRKSHLFFKIRKANPKFLYQCFSND